MKGNSSHVIPVVAGIVPQVKIQKNRVDLALRFLTAFLKKLQKTIPDHLDTPN